MNGSQDQHLPKNKKTTSTRLHNPQSQTPRKSKTFTTNPQVSAKSGTMTTPRKKNLLKLVLFSPRLLYLLPSLLSFSPLPPSLLPPAPPKWCWSSHTINPTREPGAK
ncbi:hypothetical protein KC19_11G130600 [Ceratodon purpureus]|uniref:Uncharacterized protein n=1 Tax=Ceratodon purpureus TaxID=3225 RepID=A0A8T0GGK1_CERPU|nr:hypothetical protein KC19_11G130600 [Ceratodon purpureus]